jgi:5-methylcytosine-specific restriction protein A
MRYNDENYKKLINTWRWQKLRRAKLSADPLCEECRKMGRAVRAEQVHHIVPIESVRSFEAMKALAYDRANLMSVCKECHAKIHAKTDYKGRITRQVRAELDYFERKFMTPGDRGQGDFSEGGGGAPNSAPLTAEKR